LLRVLQEQAFSNRLLSSALARAEWQTTEKAWITEMLYGTLRQQAGLREVMQQCLTKRHTSLPPFVEVALLLGIYQLLFTRVPHYAAVDGSVGLLEGQWRGLKPLVNGILRRVARECEHFQQVAAKAPPQWLPPFLLAELQQRRGQTACSAWIQSMHTMPAVTVRPNTLKTDTAILQALWHQHGIESHLIPMPLWQANICPPNLALIKPGNLTDVPGYAEGWFTVQDVASTAVGYLAQPIPGQSWLDICAAPGGKATHLGELLKNQGNVHAVDLHPHKMRLIETQKQRLHLNCLLTYPADMTCPQSIQKLLLKSGRSHYDGVLVDAPCSGLGTVRRHPERSAPTATDIQRFATLQQKLLLGAANLVRPGGHLVYSVCTVTEAEGPQQIAQFLHDHPQFTIRDIKKDTLELWTDTHACDSFYAARLERVC
jgi:16S rRNA (cytosine967-C5)-methyltransferase